MVIRKGGHFFCSHPDETREMRATGGFCLAKILPFKMRCILIVRPVLRMRMAVSV